MIDAVEADRALKAKRATTRALGDYPAVATELIGERPAVGQVEFAQQRRDLALDRADRDEMATPDLAPRSSSPSSSRNRCVSNPHPRPSNC